MNRIVKYTLKLFLLFSFLSSLIPFNSMASDSGPRVVGCDYQFPHQKQKTDSCLILGSGANQGIVWIAFNLDNKKYRHFSSDPNIIEEFDDESNTVRTYKVKNESTPCRPGGNNANKFTFEDGTWVCLYF